MPFGIGPAGWAYLYPSAYSNSYPYAVAFYLGRRGYGRRGRCIGAGFGRRWFMPYWYGW